ncbi:hypothetical protein [[Kitasatospora] papulosa]|uniref:hypothetical protein n=1 Tax=[Kitasatospora] papulosa TaxID=1464011 RepID=UPI0037F68F20
MIVVTRYESMQYDGTNGEQIAEWLPGTTFEGVAEDGVLSVNVDNFGMTYLLYIPPQWWALRGAGQYQGIVSAADYEQNYYELPGT